MYYKVFQMPLDRLFALKSPPLTITHSRDAAITFVATEVGQFCRGLANANIRCVEALCMSREYHLIAPHSAFVQLCNQRDMYITNGLALQALTEARGRNGIRGLDDNVHLQKQNAVVVQSKLRHAMRMAQFALMCVKVMIGCV
jgi:hypothetical protein